jgi:hypothetical protein
MYRVIDYQTVQNEHGKHICAIPEGYNFETKKEVAQFISDWLDNSGHEYFMFILRNVTMHSEDKEALKGFFDIPMAVYTITNGNRGEHKPIELYGFDSFAQYEYFVRDK